MKLEVFMLALTIITGVVLISAAFVIVFSLAFLATGNFLISLAFAAAVVIIVLRDREEWLTRE